MRMSVNKYAFLAITCLVLSTSCKKLLIKPDPESSPERNFEMFWNDLNNGYPYFVEDNIDWKGRYDKYRPMISSSTTTDQLYTYMTEMLKGFSDGHLSVEYKEKSYSNEKTDYNWAQLVRKDASGTFVDSWDPIRYYVEHATHLAKSNLNPSSYHFITASNLVTPTDQDTICHYGLIKDENIVYVNITTFLTRTPLDAVLRDIFQSYPTATKLILDLRLNRGGNLGNMWNAIGVLLPPSLNELKYGYVKEKVGPLPENFGAEQYFAIFGTSGMPRFTGSIVLLTNRLSVSASEHATLAIKELKKYNKKIKVVGDYTFGATSFIVQRTLPCEIKYTLVNSKTYDVNRTVVERTGVKPDEQVFLLESAVYSGIDNQLERAIEISKKDLF